MTQQQFNILIVDDHEAKRYAVATVLRQAGFAVEEAATGKDGIWLAVSKLPSLIVLDVNLPDISGFEVLMRLKARRETAAIPVLHLSATRIASADRVEGLDRGADAYLAGDVEPHELIATIKALLRLKKSEELANQLSRQWLATFNAISDSVCVLDKQRRIVQCNRQMASLLGHTTEALLGCEFDSLLVQLLGIPREFATIKSEAPPQRSNREWLGRGRWFWHSSDPILDEHGYATGTVETLRETTSRKQQEQELQEAKRAAEQANVTKSAFLANMSHEIRTPLGSILGFAELLTQPELTEEEKHQFLETVIRNASDLEHLVDDILDLSKVEAGRLDIERIQFSLRDLLSDVLTSLRVRAHNKAISLRLVESHDMPEWIVSDPTRLRQILLNVIGNAIKFTERGFVEVTVGTKVKPDADGHYVTIRVKDTGHGITEAARSRLFQAFLQGDNSTTRRFGGTGLGLALSRNLARALGGDLVLSETLVSVGSVFTCMIDAGQPQSEASKKVCQAATRPMNGSLARTHILLAEDAPDNQLLISHYLAASGAAVDTVDNGLDAVKSALERNYDVIIMDMQMPVLDGYSATQELRRRGYKKPIIALTAHAMREEREKSLHAGCNDHLTKPISGKHLVETVYQYVTPPDKPIGPTPVALSQHPKYKLKDKHLSH